MDRLKDKVALVTGAASNPGLGWAIAHRFASEGAKLGITDIDEAGLAACMDGVKALGAEVAGWQHDVTSEDDWKEVIERCIATYGRLDVLVNNAGIAVLGHVADMTLDDYERQMKVNMTSVFLGTRCALAAMRAG